MSGPRGRPRLHAALALAVALPYAGGVLAAQTTNRAQPNYVEGRVLLVSGREELPLPDVWVALNRVAEDGAGVLDSMRTDADGRYRFTYRRTGDPAAIYFTDVRHAGVAYFTDPLRSARVVGGVADLFVFDTIAVQGLLRVRGRHIVVGGAGADGRRPVVEVFELTNDTSYTIVPGGDDRPVWSIELPAAARDPEVGDGDLGPGVVRFRGTRAELHAPISPGLRQLALRYTLPASAFPLTVPLRAAPDILEVLLASPDARAVGAGLHLEGTVQLEGTEYRRYLSPRVPAGSAVTIHAPARGAVNVEHLVPGAVIATGSVLLGALVLARRRPAAAH